MYRTLLNVWLILPLYCRHNNVPKLFFIIPIFVVSCLRVLNESWSYVDLQGEWWCKKSMTKNDFTASLQATCIKILNAIIAGIELEACFRQKNAFVPLSKQILLPMLISIFH